MMKLIVIGLLYNLLLQSNAAGDPMVRVQLCSDIFTDALTDSLNQSEPSEWKTYFGDIKTQRPKGNVFSSWKNAWLKKQSKVIQITNVQLEVLQRSQILSNNSFETRLKTIIKYGKKPLFQIGKKTSQNNYLFLTMNIIAILNFKVNKDKIAYNLQECEVYQKIRDTDLVGNLNLDPVKPALCNIVRNIINIMNENWKDYLIINPSGDAKLVLKSVSQINPSCLELNLNLVVGNSRVISAQRHDVLSGSGISLLKDYINNMWSSDVHLTGLNKILEKNNLQLSPDELQRLIHDVSETEPTDLKATITEIPPLNINAENETMTVMTKLLAFSSKSDKSIFEVMFKIKLKMEFLLNDGELQLHFLSSEDPVILTWNANIGKSGDLDYENLKKLIKKITTKNLLPALDNLHISVRIPFWNLASKVAVKPETVQIFPEER